MVNVKKKKRKKRKKNVNGYFEEINGNIEKYNEIWDKVSYTAGKKFDSNTIKNIRQLK